MDKYKETFDTWNKVASVYQEKFMNLDLYNETYDFICNSIDKREAKLLEIGCGPGNITRYLLSKRPDFNIFGVDIAPNMIELARVNNPSASFEVMDARQIGDLRTKYDAVISGFCLPYLSQTESTEFIFNAYRLLNENGLIYISFVEGNPNKSDFQVGSGGRVFFNFYNLDNIIKQLITTEFSEIKTFKREYQRNELEYETHTIIIAKKKNAL
jgi:cyclopropane fatty-acyl-phospholipid synthase-like methyltransferase